MSKELSREGHRQRIRDAYIKNGAAGMQYHNMLELILTYAIPRKDVKETAYGLLNHFGGDFEKVFEADYGTLCAIDGIGENAAWLIKLFGDIPKHLYKTGKNTADIINSYASAKEYVENRLSGFNKDELLVMCLNNSSEVICCNSFCTVADGRLNIEPLKIIEYALINKAAALVLIRVKPERSYKPGDDDVDSVIKLSRAMKHLELNFNDYIIVGKDGTFSMTYDVNYMNYFTN